MQNCITRPCVYTEVQKQKKIQNVVNNTGKSSSIFHFTAFPYFLYTANKFL